MMVMMITEIENGENDGDKEKGNWGLVIVVVGDGVNGDWVGDSDGNRLDGNMKW